MPSTHKVLRQGGQVREASQVHRLGETLTGLLSAVNHRRHAVGNAKAFGCRRGEINPMIHLGRAGRQCRAEDFGGISD